MNSYRQFFTLTALQSTLSRLSSRLSPTPSQRNWFSRHWHILDGSAIKLLAILFMTIDHAACFICWRHQAFITPFLTIGSLNITVYALMRAIGRMAFPIFSFLLIEGFIHTSNRFKYGRNLFLFALLSEIPFDLARHGAIFSPGQNVFFTLFLAYLAICAIHYLKDKTLPLAVSLFSLLIISIFLNADYGCNGFGFILILYLLHNTKIIQAVVGCCILGSRWVAGLAFIPLSMYNGKRGFIKGKFAKYLFYIYYPLHLLIIYFIIRFYYLPH